MAVIGAWSESLALQQVKREHSMTAHAPMIVLSGPLSDSGVARSQDIIIAELSVY